MIPALLGRRRPAFALRSERLLLRPPQIEDFEPWALLRRESEAFLAPWEPARTPDHLSLKAFRERVRWAARCIADGRATPLFLLRQSDGALLGAATLDNIRRGPAMCASLGYWIGAPHARQGYMTEAVGALRDHAFGPLGLSRIEAACLPENAASRAVLERCGFKYEGVAQSYLQIAGRWRTHVLYAALRADRRGRVGEAGEGAAFG
ncbi:MAG: GNAT family protein [Rubrimonas sp.]|uniref:GNAT family N-acetyltransferase n=1 Tax=Rubrimonas sp. TaxID=2036015 RepID=UPI002FDD3741